MTKEKTNKKMPLWARILCIFASVLLSIVLIVYTGEKLIFAKFFKDAEREMKIPGLWSGFVPQGFDKLDDDTYLMSGYHKDGKSPSILYIVDDEQEKCELYNADGTAYTSHAGGVTHFSKWVYVAHNTGEESTYCDMFLLSDIMDGDGKAVKVDSVSVPLPVSYCSIYDGVLYAGAFYRDGTDYSTPESHRITTPCGDENTALMAVMTLDENTGKPVHATPELLFSTTSNVQGMCFTDSGKIVLSTSWGLTKSHLLVYDLDKANTGDITFNGVQTPIVYLDGDCLTQDIVCPPMAEELVYENGRVLILTESASMKYLFGKLTSGNFVRSFPVE